MAELRNNGEGHNPDHEFSERKNLDSFDVPDVKPVSANWPSSLLGVPTPNPESATGPVQPAADSSD